MTDIPGNETLWNVRRELLSAFEKDGFAPVQTSADELVTVRVDAGCQLRAVSFHGIELVADERARLEGAVVTAVNEAIRQVAILHAQRLSDIIKNTADGAT